MNHWNEYVFNFINQWAGKFVWLDEAAVIFTQYVEWVFVAMLLWLWYKGHQRTVLYAGLTAVTAMLIGQLIGLVYWHPRPFMVHAVHQLIPHAADTSFPSDHALGAFSLAFAVAFRNRKWGAGWIALAALTGVSRLFVGVHYPADIIGAIVIAAISAMMISRVEKHLEPFVTFVLNVYGKIFDRLRPRTK